MCSSYFERRGLKHFRVFNNDAVGFKFNSSNSRKNKMVIDFDDNTANA